MAPTTPAPAPQTVRPTRNGTSDPRKLLLLLFFGIVGNLFLIAIVQIVHRMEASARSASATNNVSQSAAAPTPTLPCQDAWQREAQGLGDHRDQTIDHFDVGPTPAGCFEEWIYVPSNWSRWGKTFFPGGPDCQVWFWFFGSERPIGPYSPNDLPDFPVGPPTKWRISTNCTIRYFRTA